MNTLQHQAEVLQRMARELLHPETDDRSLYTDYFARLNAEVFAKANDLYRYCGKTAIEEGCICLALLMGYQATFYNLNKEARVQKVLERCWKVLKRLPASLLKVQLLAFCYGEVYEEELALEAHLIIESWNERHLTPEEIDVIEMFERMEADPYPYSMF